jgi:phage-related protein
MAMSEDAHVNVDVSVKLVDRLPHASQLTDLVAQIKTQISGVQVPGLPLEQIRQLTAGFGLALPDTSTWHTVIPLDVNTLLQNFPDVDALAGSLSKPLAQLQSAFAFDVAGQLPHLEDVFTSLQAPSLKSPEAFLKDLSTPLSALTKLFQNADLTRLLTILGDLLGAKSLEQAPENIAAALDEILTILHDRVEGIILAFLSLSQITTATDRLERLLTALTSILSPEGTNARFQAVLQQYGSGADGLAAHIQTMHVTDVAQVQTVQARLQATQDAFTTFTGSLVRDMAFTEATLVLLDTDLLQEQFERLSQTLARIDTAPLKSLTESIQRGVQRLTETLNLDPGVTLEQYIALIHTGLTRVNTALNLVDLSQLDQVLKEAVDIIKTPFRKLEEFKVEVETLIRGAFQTVREAIERIDLTPLHAAAEQAFTDLEARLNELDTLLTAVRQTISAALHEVKAALDGVKSFLLDPQNGLKKKIEDLFHAVFQIFAEVNLQGVVDGIAQTLEPISAALSSIEFTPIIDATVTALDAITEILQTVAPLLVTDALKQKLSEAAAFLRRLDFDHIGETLTDAFDEILASVDEQAFSVYKAEYQKVIDAVDTFDPAPALQSLQQEVFEPLVAELEKLQPAALLQPIQAGYNAAVTELSGFHPSETFAFMTRFFDEILSKFHEISPTKLLEPIQQALDDIRTRLNAMLHIDDLVEALDKVKAIVQPAVKALDLTPLLAQMSAGHAALKAALTDFDPQALVALVAGVLRDVFAPNGAEVDTAGVLGALQAMTSRVTTPGAHFAMMQQSLQAGQAALNQVDIKAALAALRAKHGEVQTALAVHGTPPLVPVDIILQVTALDPMPLLSPLLPKVDRVRAAFTAKAGQFAATVSSIAPTFGAVSDILEVFRPLVSLLDLLKDLALEPFRRLFSGQTFTHATEIILHFLDAVEPAQWRPELEPLLSTIHSKLQALVDDTVLNPIAETVRSLKALTDLLNISVLTDAIQGVFDEVEGIIQQFNPAPLVQAIDEVYQRVLTLLQKLDPGAFITEVDTLYHEDIVGVVQAISPEELLLPVLRELFDTIKETLVALDIEVLFKPVIESLRGLEQQLSEGLHRTGVAYEHMLDALDAATDGSASVTVSASVSVG